MLITAVLLGYAVLLGGQVDRALARSAWAGPLTAVHPVDVACLRAAAEAAIHCVRRETGPQLEADAALMPLLLAVDTPAVHGTP